MSTTRWLESVRAAALAAVLAAVAACSMQEESGPDTTQQRTVAAFDAIDLRGAAQLDVLAGAAPSLTLAGRPGAIDAVITRVEGGTLVIENKGRGLWQPGPGKVQVRVTTPTLASLEISGAGQVTVSGMAGGELKLLLQGAAQHRGQWQRRHPRRRD